MRLQSAQGRTLRLDGGLSNPDGLASHVRTAKGDHRLVRGGGQLYASGVAYENVAAEAGEKITVQWPSGLSQTVSITGETASAIRMREPVRVELGSRRVKPGGAMPLVIETPAAQVRVDASGGEVDAPVRGEDGRWRTTVRASSAVGEVVLTITLDGVAMRVKPRLFVRPD
jgi:hypothetical protein